MHICTYICVSTVYIHKRLWNPEESFPAPRTGVTGGREPLGVGPGTQTLVLWKSGERCARFTAEPSPDPASIPLIQEEEAMIK